MRGKVAPLSIWSERGRITPAYAGKRPARPGYAYNRRDHPRVCGEKPDFTVCPERQAGITPAYAGKRNSNAEVTQAYEDHPRVCGEKSLFSQIWENKQGSPPRMRGKACRGHLFALPKGITPAYAGKSKGEGYSLMFSLDHPRVCGEKT